MFNEERKRTSKDENYNNVHVREIMRVLISLKLFATERKIEMRTSDTNGCSDGRFCKNGSGMEKSTNTNSCEISCVHKMEC